MIKILYTDERTLKGARSEDGVPPQADRHSCPNLVLSLVSLLVDGYLGNNPQPIVHILLQRLERALFHIDI